MFKVGVVSVQLGGTGRKSRFSCCCCCRSLISTSREMVEVIGIFGELGRKIQYWVWLHNYFLSDVKRISEDSGQEI